MLLAIGPFTSLTDFLQLVCWIVLPILILTALITVIYHYFRKKRNSSQSLADDEIAKLTSPQNASKPAYLLFDHTGIIRQYQHKLSYSHARYTALRKDFEQLERKYNNSKKSLNYKHSINKQVLMENMHEQQPSTAVDVIPTQSGGTLSEITYLKDLVEEKNAQVGFLQSQLEQRIRKQHEVEYNLTEKERVVLDKQQVIVVKEEQLAYSEGQLKELRQQNELLNASIADNQEKLEILSRQLDEEQVKFKGMEEKLQANRELLRRLYKEFTTCIESDETPVVINMRPTYLSNVAEE